jgi:heptosyltransferase II
MERIIYFVESILFILSLSLRRIHIDRPKHIKKVIIVQNAKLGDMVCTTPMFRALKTKYPNAKLAVVGNIQNKTLLQGNPNIDSYIAFDRDHWSEVITSVKDFEADFGCVCTPDVLGLKLLLKAGVPFISAPKIENGWSPWETRIYKLLRLFAVPVSHRMGHYAPREYLKLLSPIKVYATDTRKELYADHESMLKMNNLLMPFNGRIKVAIAPGAGNKIKEWPPEKFNMVARFLIEKYDVAVILIGADKDSNLSRVVKESLQARSVLDTVGMLNIEELKALIKQLNLFISVDTGPIYIAEAFGIPTIDIVGPMDENEQPPHGNVHIVILPPRREKSELHVMNARFYNKKKTIALAQSTEVSEVEKAAIKLLSGS